ncbi:MAG: hypothetical protein JWO95_2060 [Verrucomicrobiales bacterium]|nr:hypothetical protein [Verrucomicrobiales bacterium]
MLLTVVEGSDESLRETALRALGEVKGDPHCVVPVLIREAQGGSAGCRAMAAIVLRVYGQHARDAIPVLQKLSHDTDPQLANAAQSSLDRIEQEVFAHSARTNR